MHTAAGAFAAPPTDFGDSDSSSVVSGGDSVGGGRGAFDFDALREEGVADEDLQELIDEAMAATEAQLESAGIELRRGADGGIEWATPSTSPLAAGADPKVAGGVFMASDDEESDVDSAAMAAVEAELRQPV